MAHYAGKGANVDIGAATALKFSDWSVDMEGDILDVTNFESGGYRENIAGLFKATIVLKGPYDAGAMVLTVGASASVVLTVGGSVTFTITARCSKIRVTTNVEGFAEVEATFESNGSFTAATT